jgi:hypothetical protein
MSLYYAIQKLATRVLSKSNVVLRLPILFVIVLTGAVTFASYETPKQKKTKKKNVTASDQDF